MNILVSAAANSELSAAASAAAAISGISSFIDLTRKLLGSGKN